MCAAAVAVAAARSSAVRHRLAWGGAVIGRGAETEPLVVRVRQYKQCKRQYIALLCISMYRRCIGIHAVHTAIVLTARGLRGGSEAVGEPEGDGGGFHLWAVRDHTTAVAPMTPASLAGLGESPRAVGGGEDVVGIRATETGDIESVCPHLVEPVAFNVPALVTDDPIAELDAPLGRQRVVEQAAVICQEVVPLITRLVFGEDTAVWARAEGDAVYVPEDVLGGAYVFRPHGVDYSVVDGDLPCLSVVGGGVR